MKYEPVAVGELFLFYRSLVYFNSEVKQGPKQSHDLKAVGHSFFSPLRFANRQTPHR
jgi:hypothetical protein